MVDRARSVALDVLRAASDSGAFVNLALPAMLAEWGLSGRDAAFVTALVAGTLRRRGTYDAVLAACVDRPLDQVDPVVLDVLRLGCHQLLDLRTPPHAAVSTSVELVHQASGRRPGAFVNAVLRRVARRPLEDWLQRVVPADAGDLDRLAVTFSHPRWIVAAFHEALGGDLDATQAALAADNEPPLVTLAARPGRCAVRELVADGAQPGRWSPYAATLTAGDPAAIPAVHSGRAGVQDEGSQLVALALAAARLGGADERWLDLCAGPGGKAAMLAGLAGQRGARLLASDARPHRAALVAAALADSGSVLGVLAADGRRPAWRSRQFDRALVDAPCTGLGALRRRPEARWRHSPRDLQTLVPLQRGLLHTALDAVRPGGVVLYATCSPHPAETRAVVDSVCAERTDATEEDARPLLPQVPAVGEGPHVQLWPHLHGTDAMFVALLRRAAR